MPFNRLPLLAACSVALVGFCSCTAANRSPASAECQGRGRPVCADPMATTHQFSGTLPQKIEVRFRGATVFDECGTQPIDASLFGAVDILDPASRSELYFEFGLLGLRPEDAGRNYAIEIVDRGSCPATAPVKVAAKKPMGRNPASAPQPVNSGATWQQFNYSFTAPTGPAGACSCSSVEHHFQQTN